MAINRKGNGDGDGDDKNITVADELGEFEMRGLGNVKKCAVNPISIKQDVVRYTKNWVTEIESRDSSSQQ